MNSERLMLRDTIIKLSKDKDRERVLKSARDKWVVTSKGSSIRLSATFLSKNSGHQKVEVKSLSCVQLFVTPRPVAYQASRSMGFSRQEYWSRLP